MSIIKELDPAVAWKAIEGYQNELDPERKTLDAYYRQFSCVRCKGPVRKEFSVHHTYADPNTMGPRALLRCTNCKCLFDPHTSLVIELGTTSHTPGGVPLINGDER